jgi:hypothetical protein
MHGDGFVIGQPPQPRFGIARRWVDRHRADLDRTEAEPGERADRCAALVKACGEANRVREIEAGNAGCEPGVVDRGGGPHRSGSPAETRTGGNGEVMRGFRIEPEGERAEKR